MPREAQRPPSSEKTEKKPWETPKLSYVGAVEDVVQQGGGKLTRAGDDPGEHRKNQANG